MSQPARAVWIEINPTLLKNQPLRRHSLRGLCGLKLNVIAIISDNSLSQPARAVWIEICNVNVIQWVKLSQPARAVWIEIGWVFKLY